MRTFIASIPVFLALLATNALAQVPSREARVTINVVERDMAHIVDYLRDRSGANIEIIDTVEDSISTTVVTSLQLTDVHWRTALEIAAEKIACVIEERQGGVLLVTKPAAVIYEARDLDIADVIDMIAITGRANVVIAPEVVGTISVRFNGVPWRDALEVVAKTRGYTVVEERGGVLRVVDPVVLQDQLVTEAYQLRYLRPRGNYVPKIESEFIIGGATPPQGGAAEHFTVLNALRKALSQAGDLDYIERQNVVLVRDTQQVHETIESILATLDIEPLQVFCDVKFVSTLSQDILNLGVDYGGEGPLASFGGGQIPITLPFDPGAGGFEDMIIASPNGVGPFIDSTLNGSAATIIPDTVFGALSFTKFAGTLRMLQQDVSSEVIQAPKIVALDGVPATIFVGETIRYAEAKSEQGQAGGLQLSIQEASSSPVEVGFQLLITPHIIPGTERIMLEVIPKETSLSGTGDSALAPQGFEVFTIGAAGLEGSIALPRTRSSTMVTTMMLDSGQTAVIGGLTTDADTETESRVPLLSRIPLVGELFKYRSHNRDRRSLLIFLTPTIVHSRQDQELLLQQELGRRRRALADEIEAMVGRSVVPGAPRAEG
jgi:type II secretory pathway component GspD/PulD (secretin)